MDRFFYILPICLGIIFSFASTSLADVVLEDVRVNNRITMNESFTTGTIETGEGFPADYILSACAVSNPNSGNIFSLPTPGDWTELDQGQCGTDTSCISGVWGRFEFTHASTETTCSWSSDAVFVYGAGSFRFSGVDADPIIDVACDSGDGNNQPGEQNIAFAPSINTEAGSYVVQIYTFMPVQTPPFPAFTSATFEPEERFEAYAFNSFQTVVITGIANFYENAGPTGPLTLNYDPGTGDNTIIWRACTIGIRMGTPPTAPQLVPTMSEWGLISFAALAGIAGFFFLRRRKATA